MFRTGSGKEIMFENIADAMLSFYERNRHYDAPFSIIIGTDSQNFADHRPDTKIVTAVCFLCEGHGGIYFYSTEHISALRDIRTKLHTETQKSLEAADRLLEILTDHEAYDELYMNSRFMLHIDAGYEDNEYRNPSTHSGTEALIPELVAWVNAMGFSVAVKPDAAAASGVANRISK